jgi:putative nucleotidyltransferase with HDIG domain
MYTDPVAVESEPLRELDARLQARLEAGELRLPMLAQTATEVVAICSDSSCDAGRLTRLILRDPSLAAHALKVANSGAYSPTEPIVSLQQAISRLGFSTLCDIAIGISMRNQIRVPPGQEARMRALWTHSTLAGAWAREIARLRRRNAEGAFLCGLLHDIGKPVVLTEALSVADQLGVSPDQDQLECWMHRHHEQAGARTLNSWKLPLWMSQAVLHHHAPDPSDEHVEFARTAQLADLLAHASRSADPAVDALLREHPVLADLDLYPEDLDTLFCLRTRVDELARAFQ